MWKNFLIGYIKGNRASCLSIMTAALIASMFLSFICGLYYNLWVYEIERVVLDEGGWQVRVKGDIDEEDIFALRGFENVEEAVVNADLSTAEQTTVDIRLLDARSIFQDVPVLTEKLGLPKDAAEYHLLLLSRYLIHDPADPEPPMLLTFYLVILLIVSLSLILIIYHSFAVSMNARVRQFGILSSVGATPAQIRTCLMQESAVLCTIPILLGSVIGIGISRLMIGAINLFAGGAAGRHEAVFQYHPAVFLMTLAVSIITVFISAWLPARRLSRLAPIQAIRDSGEWKLKHKKHSPVLSLLFGIEGELAGNAIKAQKKAFRTSTLSLTLSFLGFTFMLCLFTLSAISTDHTYFQRYQDVWDVMMTVKNTAAADFTLTDQIQELDGTRDVVVYQKALTESVIPADWQSDELKALGGLSVLAGSRPDANGFAVRTQLVIMDDASFLRYCEQEGIAQGLNGCVLLNCIWDSVNSNFRYKEFIPYLNETRTSIKLQGAVSGDPAEIAILGFADEAPVLREEYDDYALVQFLPLSLWRGVSGTGITVESDTFIRVLAAEDATLESLTDLETQLRQLAAPVYRVESENRIQERRSNDEMQQGSLLLLGAFCALLAIIGIANVFSNTMGFLRQRRREFAQYMSVGMTRESMKKMFRVEAFVIAGKPVAVTLPVTVIAVAYMIHASHLNPMEFIVRAPVVPVAVFFSAIFGFVALACFIGGKRVLKRNLAEDLRNDSVM